MRNLDPLAAETESPEHEQSTRDAGDDFFCLRYQVWYPSFDCALRTRYRTCAGCRDCDQGRFNLKRHCTTVESSRFTPIRVD